MQLAFVHLLLVASHCSKNLRIYYLVAHLGVQDLLVTLFVLHFLSLFLVDLLLESHFLLESLFLLGLSLLLF